MYCSNCGNEIEQNANYCPHCGQPCIDSVFPDDAHQNNVIKVSDYTKRNFYYSDDVNSNADGYILEEVDAGEAEAPTICGGKPRSEKVIQALSFACLVVSVMLVIIVGVGVLSDNVIKDVFSGHIMNDITKGEGSLPYGFLPVQSESDGNDSNMSTTSATADYGFEDEQSYTTVTTTMPTTTTSTRSSNTTTAKNNMNVNDMKKKIAGKWNASLPYKSMKIPAVFTFDSNGKCSCVIKALFVTKKFDGTYDVKDDGSCSITLYGLEDYVGGSNTMVGKVNFVNDNKLEFTSDGTVWVLVRA